MAVLPGRASSAPRALVGLLTAVLTGLTGLAVLAALLPAPAVAVRAGDPPSAAKPRPPSSTRCAADAADVALVDTVGEGSFGTDITGGSGWSTGPRRGPKGCYWVTVNGMFGKKRAQVVQVLVDTRWGSRRTRGIEYYAYGFSDQDKNPRKGAYLVKKRKNKGFGFARCPIRTEFATLDPTQSSTIGIGIPKTCLGGPKQVRIQVQVWDVRKFLPNHGFDTDRSVGDSAPSDPDGGENTVWSAAF